jgi:hypothetical protein
MNIPTDGSFIGSSVLTNGINLQTKELSLLYFDFILAMKIDVVLSIFPYAASIFSGKLALL